MLKQLDLTVLGTRIPMRLQFWEQLREKHFPGVPPTAAMIHGYTSLFMTICMFKG